MIGQPEGTQQTEMKHASRRNSGLLLKGFISQTTLGLVAHGQSFTLLLWQAKPAFYVPLLDCLH
ncbi:MAG: hypothetical protein IOC86_15780 [Aestuariivirga sp.]|nr:hypothetical protein [Aestuariivirga sp.]